MRFMVIVKANEESEAGVLPSQELLEQMTPHQFGGGAAEKCGREHRKQEQQRRGREVHVEHPSHDGRHGHDDHRQRDLDADPLSLSIGA